MANFAQGVFTPTQPEKYIGKHLPRYRSGWEMQVMHFLDTNKSISKWASEAIVIPYANPLTGKRANYIPDFFVVYTNKYGHQKAEVIEVKPKAQTSLNEAKSKHDKAHAIVNMAKFAAANLYCKQNGFTFRVISETDIFRNGKR